MRSSPRGILRLTKSRSGGTKRFGRRRWRCY
jgi:hypothetical protein